MILEIADMEIKPGMEDEFERAVAKSEPIFRAAKGFLSFALQRCIENPSRFRVFIEWDTIEDHTEGFRKSEGFQQWVALVGHCRAGQAHVDHSRRIVQF